MKVPLSHADGRLVLVPVPVPPAVLPARYALDDGEWMSSVPQDGPFQYDPYGECASSDEMWRTDAEGDFAWSYMHRAAAPEEIAPEYQYRLRDFCADLGRWKSQEPADYVEGRNRFEYVLNRAADMSKP